ncbi:MAG: nicotinamide-nucleotide amidohydrolase family protein [Spirochaetia bacterium]
MPNTPTLTAAILSLGTEITSGVIQDTHGRFLASELSAMGVQVKRIWLMQDEPEIIPAVRTLVEKHGVVLITGGLGPTSDDLTREAISEAAGISLVFDSVLWEDLKSRYGLSKAEANRKQAMVPEGFQVLPNANGTAPGIWGKVDGCLVAALPGPPRELEPLFQHLLQPVLVEQLQLNVQAETEVSCFLIPEAMLEDVCLKSSRNLPGVQWRTRFQAHRISLYLVGGTLQQREEFVDKLQQEFGEALVRRGDNEAAALLLESLKQANAQLVSVESCTGGMIGALVTNIPGSSQGYWGGFITYENQAKQSAVGVSPSTLETSGAVSEAAVLEMAEGALERSTADVSVAVSGIAGPSGGTPEKPVGTVWIAVSRRINQRTIHSRAFHFTFGSRRDIVRRRAAVAALLLTEIMVRKPKSLDMVHYWHYS